MPKESMRQRFGELLDSAGQMFWELDRSFRVVFANDFLKRIFGDPIGHVCYKFMAGRDEVCPECPVQKVFDGQDRAVSERVRYDTDGRAVWLQHTATPIKNEAGEVIGANELTIDTTQQQANGSVAEGFGTSLS